MRYLIGIPCLYGEGHTREAIESVVNNHNVDLLLIDNGAEKPVKDLINYYESHKRNVYVIRNESNIYVNPAWNQIIRFFIQANKHDYLLIMNSDLILHKIALKSLDSFLTHNKNIVPVPYISTDKDILKEKANPNNEIEYLKDSPAGVCIVLSRENVERVYPIPETLKVWFGDNWIYDNLKQSGYELAVLNNFITYHSVSQNVSRVEGIIEIIEQDKIEWEKLQ